MSSPARTRTDRVVHLPDDPADPVPPAEPPPFLGVPANSPAAWLVPVVALAATAAGALFVLRGPDGLFGLAFGGLVLAGLAWVFVSIFFPASADRTCPECGRRALGRMERESTMGVCCARCGWRDETASSHLISESEGPFEDAVLKQRGRR